MSDTARASEASGLFFSVVLVAGLVLAAARAWTWSDQVRSRQLVVLAPLDAEVTVSSGKPPLDARDGVHTWTVSPGPLEITIRPSSGPAQTAGVTIPEGLGSLMVEVKITESGDLALGYF